MLLVLLGGGAIVNVAVAWGVARMLAWPDPLTTTWATTIAPWPRTVPTHWPTSAEHRRATGWIWRIDRFLKIVDHETEAGIRGEGFVIDFISFGFPAPAMRLEVWDEFTTGNGISSRTQGHPPKSVWRAGIPVASSYFPLPARPIWPGFAINTVFYAVILWGLFAAPFALRRLRGGRRIKRGLCPKCAYPRGAGTNQVCTECGAAVVKQKAVTQKAEIT